MPLGTLDRSPPPFFKQGPSAISKLMVFSALALPLTYLPILVVANDRTYLGTHVNGRLANGLGTAYLLGFDWALARGYDFIFEMDSDFSHDPADLPRLRQAVQRGADVAVGSRWVSGGGTRNWSFLRTFMVDEQLCHQSRTLRAPL